MAFNKNTDETKKLEYEVIADYGKIGEGQKGYEIRLREVRFGGSSIKYDIRAWKIDEDGEHVGKGVRFTGEELERLCEMLNKIRDEG
jgi:hypothetical protein